MVEKEFVITSNGHALSGTLCLPTDVGRYPTVLMVHGTGPNDRDENIPGQKLDVFNMIARTLAAHGVASLRYDKRGCGKSSGDYYVTGHFDLVGDAVSWIDALTQQSENCDPNRLFVLGHSEGCIIAPQVYAQRPRVAGLILLCPFVDDMENILVKQARQIEAEFASTPGVSGFFRKILGRVLGFSVASQLKLIQRLKTSEQAVFRSGLEKIPAKALRELLTLKPREIFAQVQCPLLLIGGEKDLQCDPADVGRIAEIAPARLKRM